jgi:hypothetical protein
MIVATLSPLVLSCTVAADTPITELKTVMTQRGKLLFSDDMQKPLGPEWRTAKGKWEVVNGAVKVSELKTDMHAAAARHAMSFHHVVIQYSFKLDGARQTTLSINSDKGHLCRVLISPTGVTVRKDAQKKLAGDKAAILHSRETTIQPGTWHTLLVELQGNEMLACLDGKEIAFGEHPGLDAPKANLGLTVSGESVSFKNLRVWEALPNPEWKTTRAKLQQARKVSTNP